MRLTGGQWRWFLGAGLCVALAAVAAVLADALLARLRPTVDLSAWGVGPTLSERGRATLTDTSGLIAVTCVLPAESPAALPVGRLLRAFAQASRDAAGATFAIDYVDPRMAVGAATRLMAQGAEGPGVLLRQAGRHAFVPESALLSPQGVYDPAEAESAVAAAIARLSRAEGLEVGWLTGHGEPAFDGTNPLSGFSGLRRALENEGCRLRPVTLDVAAEDGGLPASVGALMIVAPCYPVTSAERAFLLDWLDRGGRLFCALPGAGDAGLGPLLERWGIRFGTWPRVPAHRIEGDAGLTDLLAADHPVTRELAGKARLVFGAPRALVPEAVRGVSVTPLVRLEAAPIPGGAQTNQTVAVAVAAERGGRVGADLAFRPGRVVAVGEAAFAENRYVLNHATANRDLAVNAIRWLTGLSGSGARTGAGVLRVGGDAHAWRMDFLAVALGVPFALCLALWLLTRRRG